MFNVTESLSWIKILSLEITFRETKWLPQGPIKQNFALPARGKTAGGLNTEGDA